MMYYMRIWIGLLLVFHPLLLPAQQQNQNQPLTPQQQAAQQHQQAVQQATQPLSPGNQQMVQQTRQNLQQWYSQQNPQQRPPSKADAQIQGPDGQGSGGTQNHDAQIASQNAATAMRLANELGHDVAIVTPLGIAVGSPGGRAQSYQVQVQDQNQQGAGASAVSNQMALQLLYLSAMQSAEQHRQVQVQNQYGVGAAQPVSTPTPTVSPMQLFEIFSTDELIQAEKLLNLSQQIQVSTPPDAVRLASAHLLANAETISQQIRAERARQEQQQQHQQQR